MGTTNDDAFFISKKDLKIKEKAVEVVVTLTKEQQDEALYNAIMAKPLMTGHDVLNFPAEPNDYLVEKMLWNYQCKNKRILFQYKNMNTKMLKG